MASGVVGGGATGPLSDGSRINARVSIIVSLSSWPVGTKSARVRVPATGASSRACVAIASAAGRSSASAVIA